jgi:hypothetical protein
MVDTDDQSKAYLYETWIDVGEINIVNGAINDISIDQELKVVTVGLCR